MRKTAVSLSKKSIFFSYDTMFTNLNLSKLDQKPAKNA